MLERLRDTSLETDISCHAGDCGCSAAEAAMSDVLALYAGIVSSVGLGFLVGTAYLLPITSAFLILTVAVVGFRARQRRGFGPLLIGLVASAAVLVGKFYLESNSLMYGGVGLLVVASGWNAWPHDYSRVSELRSRRHGASHWNVRKGRCEL